MASSNTQVWNTKHILPNNLWSKQSQFFINKFYKKCGLEASSRPFLIFKESPIIPYEIGGGLHVDFDKLFT